jgi:transglutaminase-like putative cysteine protease
MKQHLLIKGMLVVLVWLGVAASGSAQKRFSVSKTPEWVRPASINYEATPNNADEAGTSYLLLLDKQFQVEQEEAYQHFAMRILNESGLQQLSDISVNYDPLFQSLSFHSILVYRNGKEINKLKAADFKIIQQETGANEYLYDGSLSAVIHLKDMRIGDVLSYSFTIKGRNPINEGKFYEQLRWQWGEEVAKVSIRMLHSPQRKLHLKESGEAPTPITTTLATGLKEWLWEKEKVPALVFDSQIPGWYDPTPVTYISEMSGWGDVVQLLRPSYRNEKVLTDQQWQALEKQLFLPGDTMDEKLTKLLHFVQNDIRYLGLENGISAYKPHPPAQVLEQKFGDCKDKALLLCALLQKLGVTAYPALVNTYMRGQVAERLPSPAVFNHCIVQMHYKDSTYWFDATANSQGGTYKTVSLPHYQKALIIKEGETTLQTVPNYPHDRREIQEYYHVKKGSEPTSLFIMSKYKGYEAEVQRSYFKNSNIREIEKGYLNYFASLYPAISLKNELKHRDRGHSFETEENYEIAAFWEQKDEQEGYHYASFYPLYLNDFLQIPDKKIRQMPYQLNFPLHISEEMVIEMPEAWTVKEEKKQVSNEFFTLDYEIIYDAPLITLKHDFRLHKDHVPADKIAAYTKDMNKAKEMIGYELYYVEDGMVANRISIPMLVLTLLMLGLFIVGFYVLYTRYDPQPQPHEFTYDSLGGWLILPMIGLIFSVPTVLYSTLSWDYFNANALHRYFDSLSPFYNPVYGTISVLECLFNLCIAAMGVMLLLLISRRRTSFPRLMCIYLVTNFAFLLLELFVLDSLDVLDESALQPVYTQLGRSLISCLIWVPYMLVSERVKQTFTVMRHQVVAPEVYAAVEEEDQKETSIEAKAAEEKGDA